MSTAQGGSSEPRPLLPPAPSLDLLRDLAKALRKGHKAGRREALTRFLQHHPTFADTSVESIKAAPVSLRDAQIVIAREYGFTDWTALKQQVFAAVRGERAAAVEALCQAAGAGDLSIVAELLDAHPHIIDVRGGDGERTALHFAAYAAHEDMVEFLLARGASHSVRCVGDGGTPLHFAAERPHLDIMRRLLAAGADPIGAGDLDDMGVIGWATVLQAAPDEPQVAFEQRRLAVELLLQQGAKHTIWSAIAVGDVEVIGAIVEGESATLHARMSQFGRHRSPLHVAVAGTGRPQSGPFEDVVRLLLEFGARLDVEDDDGLTPLDVAALGEGVDLTSMLLDAGARLTLPAALCLGRADDITYLAKQEVDALRRGGRYATLIDQAATRATGEQIQLLIDNGADVHAGYPEERDWTPLHTAALQNNRSAAEVLVSNGADLTALDKAYQSTPMGHAAHGGHDELANWLRDQHTDQEAASTSSQSGDRRHVP